MHQERLRSVRLCWTAGWRDAKLVGMADSLSDVLKNYDFEEPPEIERVKRYIRDEFHADCKVSISANVITIIVASAALAGALRPRLHKLRSDVETEKRLVIRISR